MIGVIYSVAKQQNLMDDRLHSTNHRSYVMEKRHLLGNMVILLFISVNNEIDSLK
jgi:hypothetical protein